MLFNSIDIPYQRIYLQSKQTISIQFNSIQIENYKNKNLKSFSIDDEDTDCVAVSHGKRGGFTSVAVMRNDTDCPDDGKNCYQAIEPLENVICNGFGKTRFGSKKL